MRLDLVLAVLPLFLPAQLAFAADDKPKADFDQGPDASSILDEARQHSGVSKVPPLETLSVMMGLLAMALLCAPVRALAAADAGEVSITEYDTGVDTSFSGPEPLVSADGYHFTAVVVSKDAERLYVDDKKVAQGEPGAYTRIVKGIFGTDRTFQGALSRDGKVAAHTVLVRDDEGRPAYRLAVNGTPVGRRYADMLQVSVSPRGMNVAFVARTPQNKYLVVSAEGDGASVDTPQDIVGVADAGLVYRLSFSGRNWLYRDHKALPYAEYAEAAATPDLARIAGLTPGTPLATVEVNGKELGLWRGARALRYSPAGDLIFLARTDPQAPDEAVDVIVVNGRETRLPAYKPNPQYVPSARPGDGTSFLVEKSGTYGILRVGGRAMPELGEILPAAEWVGFSPSGRHWAVVVSREKGNSVAIDGKEFASAPRPLKNARILFDTETEFHYLADSLSRVALVCGTIGGENSPRSACARHGEAIGKKDRYQLKAPELATPSR